MFSTKFRRAFFIGSGVIAAYCAYNHFYNAPECKEIYSKYPEIRDLDLKAKRLTQLSEIDYKTLPPKMKAVSFELDWHEPSRVSIKDASIEDEHNEDTKYFCGGLEALFACVRALEQNPSCKCIYINDGNVAIAHRSGLQLHEVPTEYPSYATKMLVKRVLETLNLLPKQNPETWNYSALHFNFMNGLFHPINFIKTYTGFFWNKIWHVRNSSENKISMDDADLALLIKQSIAKLKFIENDIQNVTGKSIMNQHGRLLWSLDENLIKFKKKQWDEMNIECKMITNDEINACTLLNARDDVPIYALYMPLDGELHTDVFETTIEYLSNKYPTRFQYRRAKMVEIFKNPISKKPVAVVEEDLNGEKRRVNVNEVYSSLGHMEVYEKKRRKYFVTSVTGCTSDWICTIKKKDLQQRVQQVLDREGISLDEFVKQGRLIPSADLYNLHVRIMDYESDDDSYKFYVRATEGAIVNSDVGVKSDLVNIAYKLNHYFIGDWKILSAGSCSRKTCIKNRPECDDDLGFHYGQSGVGISVCAGEYERKTFRRDRK